MLLVGFLTGVLLYIIGSVMDRHERAEQERFWEERRRGRK